MDNTKASPYILIFILLLIFLYFFYHYGEEKKVWHQSEKEIVGVLLDIYNAEWRWYQSDIDANAVQDFWARDIAGLYFYENPTSGKAIKLISRDIAIADVKPHTNFYPNNHFTVTPYKGYFLKMTPYDENGMYLAKKDPSTNLIYCGSTFAVVAYPAFNKSLHTFIIDANKKILYKKTSQIFEVDRPPLEPEKEGWSIVK